MTPRRIPILVVPVLCTVIVVAAGGSAFSAATFAEPVAEAESGAKHWSFIPPVRRGLPAVKEKSWPKNPLDYFVLANLDKEGLRPSPEALPETLLRRVYLDLTGLPPTPAEVDAFLADKSADAYEKVVDRLLASPHYGERWGRHWLDVARYADSNGYSLDAPRSIWRYRDWVINAVNRDLPYDQFVIEQLAGDLLPNPTQDQIIATGFHRNTQINEEGGIDPEQFRVEAIVDRVATTGTGLLGLSVGCAQCHNHKYDPISQKEYFEFYSFLNNTDEPTLEIETEPGTKDRIAAITTQLKTLDAERAARHAELEAALKPADIEAVKNGGQRESLKVPAARRNDKQRDQVANYFRDRDAPYKELVAEREALKKKIVTTLVLREKTDEPRETRIHIKGDFTRPGDVVTPGVPAVMPPMKNPSPKPDRLDLAKWIVDKDNPLTARVLMNRVWQEYFGQGIVTTENDFGTQGASPTNLELLDWLALEFQDRGWSQKAMHQLIVTSATYRQSSNVRPELMQADPYNRLLARQSRLRLDAEIVRDVGLVTSGLFAGTIGGKSVYPPQPEGVTDVGQNKHKWEVSTGPDRYRRGMYTFFFRATPHPLLGAFDAPDGTATCTRRNRSNTPLQALNLLNDEAFVEFAKALAARTWREAATGDDVARIDHAFKLCTARVPSAEERQTLVDLLASQKAAFAEDPAGARALLGKDKRPDGVSENDFAAWTVVSRVLLNLDETITRE